MIRSYILKTKVTKEALVEDEYLKNESAMNSQNEYKNNIDSYLVNNKDNKRPSEAAEETKKEQQVLKNQNQRTSFK